MQSAMAAVAAAATAAVALCIGAFSFGFAAHFWCNTKWNKHTHAHRTSYSHTTSHLHTHTLRGRHRAHTKWTETKVNDSRRSNNHSSKRCYNNSKSTRATTTTITNNNTIPRMRDNFVGVCQPQKLHRKFKQFKWDNLHICFIRRTAWRFLIYGSHIGQ